MTIPDPAAALRATLFTAAPSNDVPPGSALLSTVLWPTLRRALRQALHELEVATAQAEASGEDPAALWSHRLAPDMLCLAHQVEVLADGVRGALAHLLGESDHPAAGRVFNRGEGHLPPAFAGLAAARLRLGDALAALDRAAAADPRQLWRTLGEPVTVARPGDVRRYSRAGFLWDCVLPNTVFHATMIHALLRHRGVALGKDDFLGPPAHPVA
jgi:hypothetical protein